MPELRLKQGFTYRACGPFAKHHERIQKFRETDNSKHVYGNELDKACFPHDIFLVIYDWKDLAKRMISDILKDRAYEIARNCKDDGYRRTLEKTGSRGSVNKQLAEELH